LIMYLKWKGTGGGTFFARLIWRRGSLHRETLSQRRLMDEWMKKTKQKETSVCIYERSRAWQKKKERMVH
jgi:hypothetical protein